MIRNNKARIRRYRLLIKQNEYRVKMLLAEAATGRDWIKELKRRVNELAKR